LFPAVSRKEAGTMGMGRCVLAAAASLALFLGPAFAAGYSCPKAVLDKGAVEKGGTVDPPWARHELRTASFYGADPNGVGDLPPSEEIKLDRVIQTWELSRGRFTVICRYRGTRQTVQAELPASVKRCSITTLREGLHAPDMQCD
jgi:hypothetical protein